MATFYIRVAATNIEPFILDTNDLSTARGGSLALLRGVVDLARDALEEAIGQGDKVKPLSLGASEALYQIEGVDDATASDAAAAVRRDLNGTPAPAGAPSDKDLEDADRAAALEEPLTSSATVGRAPLTDLPTEHDDRLDEAVDRAALARATHHGTFTVSLVAKPDQQAETDDGRQPADPPFVVARERALALGRWAQMQAPTMALPKPVEFDAVPKHRDGTPVPVCEVDRHRPAAVQRRFKDRRDPTTEPYAVSWSVATRRRYGFRQKQRFYLDEVERLIALSDLGDGVSGSIGDIWGAGGLGERCGRVQEWLDRTEETVDGTPRSVREYLRQQPPPSVRGAGTDDPTTFAFDFPQIAAIDRPGDAAPRTPRQRALARLDGKLAVLYADGNGFAALQERLLRRDASARRQLLGETSDSSVPTLQREIDRLMRVYRGELLARLLYEGWCRPSEWVNDRRKDAEGQPVEPAIRLETLLWGGDEILWVMPAWLGWRVVELFNARSHGHAPRRLDGDKDSDAPSAWDPDEAQPGSAWSLDGKPLHHGFGLVFCAANAPIARVQRLARHLGDAAKAVDRGRSLIAYEVLESFDHLGNDPDGHRAERCPPGLDPADLVVDGADVTAFLEAVEAARAAGLPRRRLKRLADDLHTRDVLLEDLEKRLFDGLDPSVGGAVREAVDKLARVVSRRPAAWVHLEALWDYVLPPPDAAERSGGED